MSEDRTAKRVYFGNPCGRIKAGRLNLIWLDSIVNDLHRYLWAILLNDGMVPNKYLMSKEEEACVH
jgi:hypothetical protein